MAVEMTYAADGRLTFGAVSCTCGLTHQQPQVDVYVDAGILGRLPAYIARRGFGKRCVLVADNITYPLAGETCAQLLTAAGYHVTPCVIQRGEAMEPDERACGEVLLTIQDDTDFLISVGSGSLTDTTRINAERCGLPFVCVGTAPSMDGYTSAIAPLLLRGAKIHRKGKCPEIIVCDLDILRSAPKDMVVAGVGDVLGKYIALADWKIGSIINDEIYCSACGEMVESALKKLLDNMAGIRDQTEDGIRALIEALLLSGMTVMIIGHTRAVASIEHNIAHLWEMRKLARGETPPSHGASVGVATLMVWPLFERFAREGFLHKPAIPTLLAGRISKADRVAWLKHAYGEEAASAIMAENPSDFLADEEHARRIERAVTHYDDIRAVINAMPPFDVIRSAMEMLGAPMTPAQVSNDDELASLSMRAGKDYRTRYTLFKLLDECGLLERYLA
ncbi:MAG: sn-glycerol-1-phosphate dehydrogenase [Clostridiales bacterium]|nr:sn-glycerol-1-phosphate dehydrogenase [Clostridiales bacterium]